MWYIIILRRILWFDVSGIALMIETNLIQFLWHNHAWVAASGIGAHSGSFFEPYCATEALCHHIIEGNF
jgi:hypothetical protein